MSRTSLPRYSLIRGKIIKETDAAILLQVASGTKYWFPLSQISTIHKAMPDSDELDSIAVADWILQKKGIEE